jgi:uncharacterized RDD family membrane protein YckC
MTEAETTSLTTLRETSAAPAEQAGPNLETSPPAPELSAPFVLRIGALLIDYMLVAGLLAVLTVPGRVAHGVTRSGGGFIDTFGSWIALGVGVFNFVLLPLWRGQTLGKWATGLEIARLDGSPVRLGNALLRHFVGYPLTLLTAGLGFLLTIFNADNRALHDFIAGTIVMRARARSRSVRKLPVKAKKNKPPTPVKDNSQS